MPRDIYVLANIKGGIGKTTLAIDLAAPLDRAGANPLLLGADPQQSLLAWYDPDGPLAHLTVRPAVSEADLVRDLADNADHSAVVIDTAGFGNRTAIAGCGRPGAARRGDGRAGR
ncbi:ParA family protein [Azospirillum sp. SYSU D00513]|uniref:ParA family protein n=1 Tax=Azospirillum sp. SYSU D00513 TaxID=2812561 RepID=UPI001A970FE4|nr:ParA family protein [Azospirillum sp. SYSU D00513]